MAKHNAVSPAMRVGLALAAIVALAVVPATPGNAGSTHATVSIVTQPDVLTLSGDVKRHESFKVFFTTFDTTATGATLFVTVSQLHVAPPSVDPSPVPQPIVFTQAKPNGSCTQLDAFTVTCLLGNIGPNSTIARLIEVEAPTSCLTSLCLQTATARVVFAEGGNDIQSGPQGTKNDSLTATSDPPTQLIAPTANRSKDGNCIELSGSQTGFVGTVASTTLNQASNVTFPTASPLVIASPAATIPFPCTAASTGTRPLGQPVAAPYHLDQIWFVDLQTAATLAVSHLFVYDFPTGSGVNANTFVLLELVGGDPTLAFKVPPCNADGTVPPGGPFAGLTYDSCLFARDPFGHGGLDLTVHINPFGDPSYGG
jgi:hypothetical protein